MKCVDKEISQKEKIKMIRACGNNARRKKCEEGV